MNDSLDKDLREIEAQLTNLNPTKMPDDMISRMEQAMMSWESHLPMKENIVPFSDHTSSAPSFPSVANAHSAQAQPGNMHLWGAAAAVALLAGVASVFLSSPSGQPINMAEQPNSPSVVTESTLLSSTPPPELKRNIIHASNEGFTYSNNNDEAFKVLRIEYTEKTITHDSEGNPVITEKPCLEHVLVPVPVH